MDKVQDVQDDSLRQSSFADTSKSSILIQLNQLFKMDKNYHSYMVNIQLNMHLYNIPMISNDSFSTLHLRARNITPILSHGTANVFLVQRKSS